MGEALSPTLPPTPHFDRSVDASENARKRTDPFGCEEPHHLSYGRWNENFKYVWLAFILGLEKANRKRRTQTIQSTPLTNRLESPLWVTVYQDG